MANNGRLSKAWIGVLVATTAGPAIAQEKPARIDLAGGDANAWVVVTTDQRDRESQLPTLRISVARRIGSGDVPGVLPLWRTIGPIVGQVRSVCADRERLYMQFADLSFTTLDLRGGLIPGAKLPAGHSLRTWAGDTADDAAYAVVAYSADLLASQPATGKSDEARLRLARFDGQSWQLLDALPKGAREAAAWSLAANDQRVLLAWVEKSDEAPSGRVQCAEWSKTGWGESRTVGDWDDAAVLASGWPVKGPQLLVRGRDEKGKAAVRVMSREGSEWRDAGALRGEAEVMNAADTHWSIAHGRVLAGRIKPGSGVEISWASAGRESKMAWTPLAGGLGTNSPWWAAWLDSIVTLMMIGFLFFLRPERLTQAAPLPSDQAVTLPAKRLVAGLVDLIPAALLTAYWWAPPLLAIMARVPLMEPEDWQPLVAPALWGPKLLCITAYAAYCFAWEAMTGSTPGKMLLGCRVVDETGQRPSLSRVAIRNAMRIPELAISFMTMATLFLMLVASVRRQRIADMVAGTLVVGHAIPQARPLGQQDSGGDRSSGDGE